MNTFDDDTGSFELTGNNLESIPRLGKSFTSAAPDISLADAHAFEKLHQLTESIGVSRTLPGTLGLWALVVDAAPGDVRRFNGYIDSG